MGLLLSVLLLCKLNSSCWAESQNETGFICWGLTNKCLDFREKEECWIRRRGILSLHSVCRSRRSRRGEPGWSHWQGGNTIKGWLFSIHCYIQNSLRVGTRENTGRKKTCRNCLILATALLILVGIGIALTVWFGWKTTWHLIQMKNIENNFTIWRIFPTSIVYYVTKRKKLYFGINIGFIIWIFKHDLFSCCV